jgi:antitoxin component YwqK of YwqJK toxin-antitoxin module
MKITPRFRSSIPRRAEKRITARHTNGAKATVEYFIEGQLVGVRGFDAEGTLERDCGWRDGLRHGTSYRIDTPGRLLSATPYSRGLEHGVARQWGDDGRLLGTYRMHHGTGIDLWWLETWRKPPKRYLAEVCFQRRGQPHGFEWWLNDDQKSVHEERHWRHGQKHGIERDWSRKGRLRRGYPRYFVAGQQVARRQYIKAAANDASLPPFRKAENRPRRIFPPVIASHLGDRRGRARG